MANVCAGLSEAISPCALKALQVSVPLRYTTRLASTQGTTQITLSLLPPLPQHLHLLLHHHLGPARHHLPPLLPPPPHQLLLEPLQLLHQASRVHLQRRCRQQPQ